jgi:tRNA threonylcarbamoyladenosine biosynthesis protein TsaB
VKLLALDTAAEQCSVALWVDGAITAREALAPPTHAERILPMVAEILAEGETTLARLDAVAFGRGPGAFTGVRLAASIAQGLAFAADLRVIGISDLAALAHQALGLPAAPEYVLVCQDARMAEVYWAAYRRIAAAEPSAASAPPGVELLGREQVGPAAEVFPPPEVSAPVGLSTLELDSAAQTLLYWGVGSGFGAYPELKAQLETRLPGGLALIRSDLRPHAREVAQLAARAGLAAARPPEDALPVYLRDDVATPAAR